MKKVLVVMGATGTGKTNLVMELAKTRPISIISIDSAMVYRGMDIGTAKPTKAELAQFPHALVDICEPLDNFSVADCAAAVPALIAAAHAANQLPVLVGGTMMYHYILQSGLHSLPNSSAASRAEIAAEFAEYGLEHQWERLKHLDPAYAAKLKSADKQRIHRALELLLLGERPSELLLQSKAEPVLQAFDLVNVVLDLPRPILYERLMLRFEQMLELGFVAEVESLLERVPTLLDSQAFRAIGYKQIAQSVVGNCSKAEALVAAKTATRRFAKRQCTWLKRWQNKALWLDCTQSGMLNELQESLEFSEKK